MVRHCCGKIVNKQSLLLEFSLLLLLTKRRCNSGQLRYDTNIHVPVSYGTGEQKRLCIASTSFGRVKTQKIYLTLKAYVPDDLFLSFITNEKLAT